MRAPRQTAALIGLCAALPLGALACGSGHDDELVSRDLLLYSTTSVEWSPTTTSTTTTTVPPTTTAAPLVLPPPTTEKPAPATTAAPPPPAPTPAVEQAAARTVALETVLAEIEQALGDIDAGLGNSEDQS